MNITMKYRPEIDGLRALAVLGVIFFHAGFQWCSGGYVGVDVFFVISGWIITSLILVESQAGCFSFRDFYLRRVRRILPSLFFVLLWCLPLAWFWLAPQELSLFFTTVAAVIFTVSNIFFMRKIDYFNGDGDTNPLLHAWSLSLEEQFYLLYPAFLLAILKYKKRTVAVVVSVVFFASFAVAVRWQAYYPVAAFYLLPSRAWELLVGASIAIYSVFYKVKVDMACSALPAGLRSIFNEIGSFVGLALVVYSFFALNKSTPFPGFAALFPTCGAALIILCASVKGLVGRLLGHPIFSGLGLISYSAYLWHQPLFAFARIRSIYAEPSPADFVWLIILTLLLATLSWGLVERPFRNKLLVRTPTLVVSASAVSALYLSIGWGGIASHGYPQWVGRPALMAHLDQFEFPTVQNGWCFYSVDSLPQLKVGSNGVTCTLGPENTNKRGLLFGDSFAGHYEPFWRELANKNQLAIDSITTNWCYPAFTRTFPGPEPSRAYDQCLFNRDHVAAHLKEYDFIVLAANWGNLGNDARLREVLDFVQLLANEGMFVIVMASPPVYDTNVGDSFLRAKIFSQPFDMDRIGTSRDKPYALANEQLKALSIREKNVFFIERSTMFDPQGSGLDDDGKPLSLDGKHISIAASIFVANHFERSPSYRILMAKLAQTSAGKRKD